MIQELSLVAFWCVYLWSIYIDRNRESDKTCCSKCEERKQILKDSYNYHAQQLHKVTEDYGISVKNLEHRVEEIHKMRISDFKKLAEQQEQKHEN